MNYDTIYARDTVMNRSSVKEVVEYINSQHECFISWQGYISMLVSLNGRSYERFGKKTGFSKNTVKKWCESGEMPQNRDAFIKLAFGLGMNITETNTLLTKYGRYSELYAKDLHDAVTIYVLNKHQQYCEDPLYSYSSIKEWTDKLQQIIRDRSINDRYYRLKQTIGVYTDIGGIREDSEFEQYILDNKDIFLSTYSALTIFIDDFIRIRINERKDRFDDADRVSWHTIVKEKKLDASFEKMLSALRTQGILPKRKQLIALGIHLNMVSSDINKMLELANMQPLYARDKAEALLMYILRNAERYDPDLLYSNAFNFYNITSDRKLAEEYRAAISSFLENADDADDYDERDGIEDISEYIKEQLANITPNDFFDELL
ncbi:MAG: hypothetical protein E7478_01895 [Ruminococcaceae bacterium]|nr:hypothetical protein [Oscillospiraceae bacterium]